jgi:pimeloyl-ACP methyl ester carboxylesterase
MPLSRREGRLSPRTGSTPGRARRWGRRIALVLAELFIVVTAASLVYNAATAHRNVSADELYPGPYVQVDGTTLAYRSYGTRGAPILLLGGFVEPSWVWHRVGPMLARQHRVFALDLPPFGYSQRRGPYTLARWVVLVQAFARRMGLDRPVLVGHSLGAAVAVSIAAKHPGATSGMVLLDGDARPGGGGASWLSHLLLPPWYTSVYRIVTGSDWIFRRALAGAWGQGRPPFTGPFIDEWRRPFRVTGTASALRSLLSYGIQGVSTGVLERVRGPRLVVWGAHDTVDSVSAGRGTAALLHARFLTVPRAGHLSMLAAPAGVARAIDRFAATLR